MLPLLGPVEQRLTDAEAAGRIRDFLHGLGSSSGVLPLVMSDHGFDQELVWGLLRDHAIEPESLARWAVMPLGVLGAQVAEHEISTKRRHHALDDARAFRAGRLEEERAVRRAALNGVRARLGGVAREGVGTSRLSLDVSWCARYIIRIQTVPTP